MDPSKNFRYLNYAVNILVLCVAVTIIGLLAYRAFHQPSLASIEAEFLKAGESFKLPKEVDLRQRPNTILLALDISCQYCSQSLPFYKKLIAKSKETPSLRVVALFSNDRTEVEAYLLEQNVDIEFFPNVDLAKLKVDTTPTVIWVDENGKIVGSYQGMLQEKMESAFFEFYRRQLSVRTNEE